MLDHGFHAHSGWWFKRVDGGKVQITYKGLRATFDDSAWASCVAVVSARGETGDTWREALRFHNDEPLPVLPQCCFIGDGEECANPALLVITDGPPTPDNYTLACQYHVKDLISDTALVYPINPIAAYPAAQKKA